KHAFSRWDVASGISQAAYELPSSGNFAMFHLSHDGRRVYLSQHFPPHGRVGVYDAQTGQEVFASEGHFGPVFSIAFSPDGRILASGSADQTIRLWDLAGWQPNEQLAPSRIVKGHDDEVWSVAFSPDGKVLASGGNSGAIFTWEIHTGRKMQTLAG